MSKQVKALWKFNMSYGRAFDHESLFVATKDQVEAMYDMGLYFGEIAGKHSEVFFDSIDAESFTFISDDVNVINVVEKFNLETGYNPLHAREQYIDCMATDEEE